jgi:hypothetical protein
LGIVDYSSETAPYLKAENEKCGNSINRIMDLLTSSELKAQLLKYNGYDSINEYRVALWQIQQMLPF